jgi:mRNA-degrading endonuclease toxin of MazEF toxin-antitoxin module
MLLSRNDAYSYLLKFIAVEITPIIRQIATEIPLREDEGLPKVCVVNCDSLRMVPRFSLTKRAGRLAMERESEVKRAMGGRTGMAGTDGSLTSGQRECRANGLTDGTSDKTEARRPLLPSKIRSGGGRFLKA